MSDIKGKLISAVFILLLALSAAAVIFGKVGENNENRAAATMPSANPETILSGEFAEETEAYINDRLMLRNELIDLSDRISRYKSIDLPSGKVIRADMDMGTETKQASDILVLDDSAMELFRDDKTAEDEYAEAVNAISEKLSENSSIYLMLIPTSLEFADSMYTNLQDSQKDAIDYIYGKTNGRVKTVDAYSALQEHSGEYIYFRTDHHWTMLGAYYAYKCFCAAAGQTPVNIADYEKQSIEGFTGYLLEFADSPELEEKPDTIEWYDVNTKGTIDWFMAYYDEDGTETRYKSVLYDKEKNNYDFFLGSDHTLACFTNSAAKNNKTVMIIADSYANCFAPWLMNNYKNVILADPRTYTADLSVTVDKYKPDDVLIMNYIFTTSFSDYCGKLLNLYK